MKNDEKGFYVTEQLQLKLIHRLLMASADRHLSPASSIFLSSLSNKTAIYKKKTPTFIQNDCSCIASRSFSILSTVT